MLPVPVMEAVVRRATPKSMIFTVPSLLMKMLAGLMSRWTMPGLVRVAEARQHLHDDRRACARASAAGGVRIAFCRSWPFSSSMAM